MPLPGNGAAGPAKGQMTVAAGTIARTVPLPVTGEANGKVAHALGVVSIRA